MGIAGSISGVASVLGSYQVCHSFCVGLIALLSLIGITFVGMPLLFFTKVALPFWILAVVLFCVTALLYWKKRCISFPLLLLNFGVIVMGVPSQWVRASWLFLSIGGLIVAASIVLFFRERFSHGQHRRASP